MKTKNHLSEHLPQKSKEPQALSDEKLLYTVQVNTLLVACRSKSIQLHEPTNNQVQILHLEKCTDETFLCRESGQMIPSGHRGKPDWKQLALEIALQKSLDSNL